MIAETPLSPTGTQTMNPIQMDTETDYQALLDAVFHDEEASQWLLSMDSTNNINAEQGEGHDDGIDSISVQIIYSKNQNDLCALFHSNSSGTTHSSLHQRAQPPSPLLSGYHLSQPRSPAAPLLMPSPTRSPIPISYQANPNPKLCTDGESQDADTITYCCHKITTPNHALMTLTDASLPIYISHQIPHLKSTRLRSIASVTAENELQVSTMYWFHDLTSLLSITKYPLHSLDDGVPRVPQMHVLCMDQMAAQGYTIARDGRPTARDVLYSISMQQQRDCPYCLLRGVPCQCTEMALMRMAGEQVRGIVATGKAGDDSRTQGHANAWEVWKSVLQVCESQPRRYEGFVKDPSTGECEQFEC
mmetsp:Transcript_2031/g.3642  ORF Transcript_2031/g.3642 Transcript_2031/m.3642 type:complete len:361 (-) Transcript_2031:22-1104(-)